MKKKWHIVANYYIYDTKEVQIFKYFNALTEFRDIRIVMYHIENSIIVARIYAKLEDK